MPKSKRSKLVSLTRIEKKNRDFKVALVEDLRECLDSYASIYTFSVSNMRNAKLKDVRQAWKHSRFFFGKNKVMAVALGKGPEDEYKPDLHLVAESLSGNIGLLFTNKLRTEVEEWFSTYQETDFARSGNVATKTVLVKAGPLKDFSHAIEPQLRKLGLPTSLQKGVVTLMGDHTICTSGDILTPEQARILKLFNIPMADFHIQLETVWFDNKFTRLVDKSASGDGTAGSESEDMGD